MSYELYGGNGSRENNREEDTVGFWGIVLILFKKIFMQYNYTMNDSKNKPHTRQSVLVTLITTM